MVLRHCLKFRLIFNRWFCEMKIKTEPVIPLLFLTLSLWEPEFSGWFWRLLGDLLPSARHWNKGSIIHYKNNTNGKNVSMNNTSPDRNLHKLMLAVQMRHQLHLMKILYCLVTTSILNQITPLIWLYCKQSSLFINVKLTRLYHNCTCSKVI